MECEEIVHLPSLPTRSEFSHWLHIRKKQWAVLRRRRQRQRQEQTNLWLSNSMATVQDSAESGKHNAKLATASTSETTQKSVPLEDIPSRHNWRRPPLLASLSNDVALIDELLEEQERQIRARAQRPPIDITFLFDSSMGAPDDVVVHIFQFLASFEHPKLLHIAKSLSKFLKQREDVWRQLCPAHWVLPRRPRKPWHELYLTNELPCVVDE